MIKVEARKVYTFEINGHKGQLEFVKVANVPGFSHRVVINNTGADWLANEFKPSSKSAKFFVEKLLSNPQPALDAVGR